MKPLLAAMVIITTACAGSATSPQPTPNPPVGKGQLHFNLTRSANSQIPPEATDAFIAVIHVSSEPVAVTQVTIPAAGHVSDVFLPVPPDTDLSILVVAYHGETILAAGRVDGITVREGATTDAVVAVAPVSITMESVAPGDTLVGGQQAQFQFTVNAPACVFAGFSLTSYSIGTILSPPTFEEGYYSSLGPCATAYRSYPDSLPLVTADTALVVTSSVFLSPLFEEAATKHLDMPAVRIPVKPAGSGVNVSFNNHVH